MREKIVNYIHKYEEIVAYLIVGGLNTILAWWLWLLLVYFIFDVQVIWQNVLSSIVCWVICDVVGYITNRIFVFKSKASNILKEFLQFSTGRLFALVLDSVIMVVLINLCGIHKVISRAIASVAVIIANYLISKLFVFK